MAWSTHLCRCCSTQLVRVLNNNIQSNLVFVGSLPTFSFVPSTFPIFLTSHILRIFDRFILQQIFILSLQISSSAVSTMSQNEVFKPTTFELRYVLSSRTLQSSISLPLRWLKHSNLWYFHVVTRQKESWRSDFIKLRSLVRGHGYPKYYDNSRV